MQGLLGSISTLASRAIALCPSRAASSAIHGSDTINLGPAARHRRTVDCSNAISGALPRTTLNRADTVLKRATKWRRAVHSPNTVGSTCP